MIVCRKCKAINNTGTAHCQNCGRDLLPGYPFSYRMLVMLAGIIACLFCAWMLFRLIQNPELTLGAELTFCASPVFWVFAMVLIPIVTLVETLRKTPVYTRYELRADRHKKIDPEQTLADLTEAIKLAPKKKQGALLRKRSDIHKMIGNEEEAIKDRLGYLESDIDDEDGFQSLGNTFQLPMDKITSGYREGERRGLVKLGQIKAVGFCKKCQKAVDLTCKIRCPDHPRKKPLTVKYVLPKDLDSALVEVQEAGSKQLRKKRVITIIIMVLIVVAISACIVIGYMS
jgi:hypothetical protein